MSHLSPPVEEDLAQASAWDDTSTLVSTKSKGKGKQLPDDDNDDDDDDDDDNNTINGDNSQQRIGEYPPIPEEALESRQVEENLKRWEILEKQRRKKARESRSGSKPDAHPPSSSPFSLGDVSRRASQLWSGRSHERPKSRNDRTHPHQVLENVEESVPADENGPPSASSPVDTPRTSTADTPRTFSTDPFIALPENPFENPQYAEVPQGSSSIMSPASSSSNSIPTSAKTADGNDTPSRPILQVSNSISRKHHPPRPLNLPLPASPPLPPRTGAQRQEMVAEVEGKGKQWWTDWLCGCREEGDDQAGRTNPME